jgi:hypothetical protein
MVIIGEEFQAIKTIQIAFCLAALPLFLVFPDQWCKETAFEFSFDEFPFSPCLISIKYHAKSQVKRLKANSDLAKRSLLLTV